MIHKGFFKKNKIKTLHSKSVHLPFGSALFKAYYIVSWYYYDHEGIS